MTEESARLRMPYLSAAQAQKHVTHNEALTLLDTLVQLAVLDKDLTEPPAEPDEGDCYIVGASATGEWIGWDKRIARFIDGTWRSYLPGAGSGAGWLAWVMDEDAMYRFDGTDWDLAGIEGPAGPAGAEGPQGPTGAVGPAGATSLTICRLVATSDLDLSADLEDGDAVDGVTLVEGDRVLVAGQTDASENGIYIVPNSGAASRDAGFAAFDDHPGVYFSVMEGDANADTLWRCTSNRGGTIGADDLVVSEFSAGGGEGGGRVGVSFAYRGVTPPEGALVEDGSAITVVTYPELAAVLYCGDGENATAAWGYRTTSQISPSANRSIAGNYIVLPDSRGRFLRGLDGGAGRDPGRSLWAYQGDAMEDHDHTIYTVRNLADAGSNRNVFSGNAYAAQTYGEGGDVAYTSKLTGSPYGYASETRPKNTAVLPCIWFE